MVFSNFPHRYSSSNVNLEQPHKCIQIQIANSQIVSCYCGHLFVNIKHKYQSHILCVSRVDVHHTNQAEDLSLLQQRTFLQFIYLSLSHHTQVHLLKCNKLYVWGSTYIHCINRYFYDRFLSFFSSKILVGKYTRNIMIQTQQGQKSTGFPPFSLTNQDKYMP